MKKFFLIKPDFVNSRLDRWFRRNICDVPQSLIEKNIRKGNIKINNKRKKSSYKLQKDDQIIVYNINFTATATTIRAAAANSIVNNKNEKKIDK